MTIRRVVYDNSREDGGPDVVLIYKHLLAPEIPHPPKIPVSLMRWILEQPDNIVMVDEARETIAWLAVMSIVKEVSVPWWLPRASWTENNMRDLMPVMGAACEEVLRLYPGSDNWLLYGDAQGAGETDEEVRQSSYEIAGAWVDFFHEIATTGPSPIPANALRNASPLNDKNFRPVSRVGHIAEIARRLAVRND